MYIHVYTWIYSVYSMYIYDIREMFQEIEKKTSTQQFEIVPNLLGDMNVGIRHDMKTGINGLKWSN